MGRPAINLEGQLFGRWKVLYRDINTRKNDAFWICECQCESKTIKSVSAARLRSNTSTSCGCYRNELSSKRLLIHGDHGTKFYKAWRGIKNRCLNPRSQDYPVYGGRGIKIYEPWLEYPNFKHDMYMSYRIHCKNNKTTTIERIDVNGNYSPNNCTWTTAQEQNQNKQCMKLFKATRISDGFIEISKNQREFARKYQLHQDGIWKCLHGKLKSHKGWEFILVDDI